MVGFTRVEEVNSIENLRKILNSLGNSQIIFYIFIDEECNNESIDRIKNNLYLYFAQDESTHIILIENNTYNKRNLRNEIIDVFGKNNHELNKFKSRGNLLICIDVKNHRMHSFTNFKNCSEFEKNVYNEILNRIEEIRDNKGNTKSNIKDILPFVIDTIKILMNLIA